MTTKTLPTGESLSATDALLEIQELMDGVEWSAQTLSEVADVMQRAGYRIRDLDDVDFSDDEQKG